MTEPLTGNYRFCARCQGPIVKYEYLCKSCTSADEQIGRVTQVSNAIWQIKIKLRRLAQNGKGNAELLEAGINAIADGIGVE